MGAKGWAYALIGLGIFTLVSTWGSLTQALTTRAEARGRVVSQWSTSGSPQEDKMHTRRFMFDMARDAERFEEVEPVQANLHFASTASRDDVVFVSFLSGNPPDIVEFWLSQLSDAVAAGQIHPLDGLLERENRIRDELGLPDFLSGLTGGKQAVVRFRANPNDWRIRAWQEDGSHASEAIRLLNMHGKILGFNPPGKAKALTINGRLFKEAAASGGKYAVLIDDQGNARAPSTWAEFRDFARLITEWGIETYGADNPDRPYGLIMQGMDENFFARAIEPLAATAGSMGFDFAGSDWVEGHDGPVGRYDYTDPGLLGAFKLILLMRQDGSIAPGTEQRHYEESRGQLAQGRAAMLIDGWHAAMIAAQKNPAVKAEIVSAAVPVPYQDDAGKAAIDAMLGLDVPRGVWVRDGGGNVRIRCITTGSEHPDAAWDWMYRRDRFVEKVKATMLDHFNIPTTRTQGYFVYESQEPEWVAFRARLLPYQFQAWDYVEQLTQVWPTPPTTGKVQETNARAAMLEGFKRGADGKAFSDDELAAVFARVEAECRAYGEAINNRLADLVRSGERDPSQFTFTDWDPTRASDFYLRQVSSEDPSSDAKVQKLRERIPADMRDFNQMDRPAAWPLLLAVAGLVAGCIATFILWQALFGAGRKAGGMATLGHEARRNWFAYIFVAPAVCALFVFILYPALYQVYLSFHTGTGQTALGWAGTSHYAAALSDGKFWGEVVPNTLTYMVIVAGLEVTVGLCLATLLNLPLRGITVYRTLFFLPMVVSMSVVAVIFFGILAGPNSTINSILDGVDFYEGGTIANWFGQLFGILDEQNSRIDWLNDERFALYTVMLVGVWQGLPYNTILCLAGLQSIPKDLYEAAKIDGAGAGSRFFRITIPQMAPILLIVLFNSMVGAARHFGNVFILTKGNNGTEIVSTYVFKNGFEWNETTIPDIGYAATLSLFYASMLAALIIVNVIYVGRRLRRAYGDQHHTPAAPAQEARA